MPTKLKYSRSHHNGFGHQPVSHRSNPVLMPNQRYCETIYEVSSNEYFEDVFSFEELRWKNLQSPKKDSREPDISSMEKTNLNRLSVQNVLGELQKRCSVARNSSDTKLTENRSFCLENVNTSTTQRLEQFWSNLPLPKPTQDRLFTPSSVSEEVNANHPITPREVKKRSILTINEPSVLPSEQPAPFFTNRSWFLTENISNQFGFQPTFYGVAPVFEEGNFYAELFQYPTVPPKTNTTTVNLRTKKNFKQFFSPYSRNRKNGFY